jgi:polyhydroxyalkanoate synthase
VFVIPGGTKLGCSRVRHKATGKPVTLSDIRIPVFAVGTERDHVAPWRSTYKINLHVEADITYLLTSGGHNAGIVSEPGHDGRRFQVNTQKANQQYLDPDRFLEETPRKDGSWWPEWSRWLSERSGALTTLPPIGAPQAGYAPLEDAPGTYVLME